MRNILTFALAIFMSLQPWSAKSPSLLTPSTTGNAYVVVTGSAATAGFLAIANAPVFPTTGILDSFDRSDGTIGTKWSIDRSEFKISSNQLDVLTEGMILWSPTSFGPDQEAYVTFVNVDVTASNMDLLLKSQSSGSKTSLLEVSYNPAEKIIQVTSYTTANGDVQYGANISATFSNGDQLGARATADGQVYVYKNGISLAIYDVTAWQDYAKGGYVGLLSWGGSSPIYDNFGGGAIVASVTQTPAATVSSLPTQSKTNTAIVSTKTRTSNPTVTRTAVATNTPRHTVTKTSTPTVTRMRGATNTSAPVATNTPRSTVTKMSTPTVTSSPATTETFTSVATNTPRPTGTTTNTVPPTTTKTATVTFSPTMTRTTTVSPTQTSTAAAGSFRFISWGDSQDDDAGLAVTSNQAKSLNPAFTIFNGDLENDGVKQSRMDAMTGGFGSLLSETFLIRGNHDDHVSGSAGLWENYFVAKNRPLPSGVTNYVSLDSGSTYLNYSFDYGNSRFIGLDVPGDVDLLTSAELTFLDNRLTDAENIGLTNAFIYWHGPEYCVESTHCTCMAKADGSCTPSALITIFNKHPIVSATFHGHEHILGWVHMDSSRVAGIAHPYEEFLTSPSTDYNSYNAYMYPARMDYYYPNVGDGSGFAAIDVNGSSFTFSIYVVGTTAPVWSRTFTKDGTTVTNWSASMQTPIRTPIRTPDRTPTQQ